MKKLLSLAVMLLMAKAAMAKVPVYVWQVWKPAKEMRQEFKDLKRHGVIGVCINTGMDKVKIASAGKEAHRAGLEYHAWIPTMLRDSMPESWYTVNRLGQSAYTKPAYVPYYKTLDPRNPEVRKWLVERFSEIADIPEVDYIQLDYIRYADVILSRGLWDKYNLVMNGEYANADYCYCDSCVAAFKRQTGIDITRYTDPSKVKEWAQFRCDAVTELVNMIAEAVHKKGKKLSADVFPGPYSHAYWMVRQEWNKWNVDMLFPMNYNDFYLEPASWLGPITKEEVDAVAQKGTSIISGLFICKDWRNKASVIDPENSGLLPSELDEAVTGAMKAGATGVSLFTPSDMTEEHWKAFDEVLKKLQ